jgi:flagellar assembly protein FliH
MASKLIRGHDLAERCLPWAAPEVAGTPVRGHPGEMDLHDVRSARQRAVVEGFEQGRATGLAAGARELTARAEVLEKTLDALARPLEHLDHRFHDEILALVKAVARQLVRRELRLDPTHIVGVIREGLAALPMSVSDAVVRLHPEDATVVHECLPPSSDQRSWKIEVDPLMDRGGCLIVTPTSQIDGRLETRLGRVIATMFEDERQEETQEYEHSSDRDSGE